MGMGYSANEIYTVKEEFVKEICPKEFDTFMLELENDNVELDDFAIHDALETIISREANDNETMSHTVAYVELCSAFKEKTGLSLEVMYHNQEEVGDRYDDVSGIIWVVGDVYQYTPAGEKYKKQIERKGFVTFG